MIEFARIIMANGKFTLSVVVDGQHHQWLLTEDRFYIMLESCCGIAKELAKERRLKIAP